MGDNKYVNSIKRGGRGIKHNDNNGMRVRINDMGIKL